MTDASLFMEYFVAHRAPNLPAEALAEVFDRLIWCFADNGHAICAVRGGWLQSADEYKVEIALSMNEVFPFPTRKQMEENLDRIALQFPRLREQCSTWLERGKALP
jgi:hypothetical protein